MSSLPLLLWDLIYPTHCHLYVWLLLLRGHLIEMYLSSHLCAAWGFVSRDKSAELTFTHSSALSFTCLPACFFLFFYFCFVLSLPAISKYDSVFCMWQLEELLETFSPALDFKRFLKKRTDFFTPTGVFGWREGKEIVERGRHLKVLHSRLRAVSCPRVENSQITETLCLLT